MKITELGAYCKSIKIDCDVCEHEEECKYLTEKMEDLSPCGLIDLLTDNEDLN